jgi:hypothetical protein
LSWWWPLMDPIHVSFKPILIINVNPQSYKLSIKSFPLPLIPEYEIQFSIIKTWTSLASMRFFWCPSFFKKKFLGPFQHTPTFFTLCFPTTLVQIIQNIKHFQSYCTQHPRLYPNCFHPSMFWYTIFPKKK